MPINGKAPYFPGPLLARRRRLENDLLIKARAGDAARAVWTAYILGEAAGGGVSLVVQDAAHVQTADGLTLTTALALAVADASHAQLADAATLTTAHVLAVADALHAQLADSLTLSVGGSVLLTVQNAAHAQTADGLALGAASWLAVADALHMQIADNAAITGGVAPAAEGLTVWLRRRRR